jgi:hypothetical protein
MRHRALRIAGGNLVERGACLRVGHVMQQRNSAIELRLDGRLAGRRKNDGSKACRVRLVPIMLADSARRQSRQ